MNSKSSIDYLFIEVTRRCNMKCQHCLRGSAQRVDIDKKSITGFLRNIGYISDLTITGGEPSLNVEGISFILKELKRFKIEVYRFYIVTNGSRSSISRQFIDVCIDLYNYQQMKASDPDFTSMLEMSDDEYHNRDYHHVVVERLDIFKFFSKRNNKYNQYNLVKEGRSDKGTENKVYPISIDGDRIEGDVYLNALGYITTDCDMSYKSQNRLKICHYSDFMTYITNLSKK